MEKANRIIKCWIKRGDNTKILDLSRLYVGELPDISSFSNIKVLKSTFNSLKNLPDLTLFGIIFDNYN